jgi:hypothetical protein
MGRPRDRPFRTRPCGRQPALSQQLARQQGRFLAQSMALKDLSIQPNQEKMNEAACAIWRYLKDSGLPQKEISDKLQSVLQKMRKDKKISKDIANVSLTLGNPQNNEPLIALEYIIADKNVKETAKYSTIKINGEEMLIRMESGDQVVSRQIQKAEIDDSLYLKKILPFRKSIVKRFYCYVKLWLQMKVLKSGKTECLLPNSPLRDVTIVNYHLRIKNESTEKLCNSGVNILNVGTIDIKSDNIKLKHFVIRVGEKVKNVYPRLEYTNGNNWVLSLLFDRDTVENTEESYQAAIEALETLHGNRMHQTGLTGTVFSLKPLFVADEKNSRELENIIKNRVSARLQNIIVYNMGETGSDELNKNIEKLPVEKFESFILNHDALASIEKINRHTRFCSTDFAEFGEANIPLQRLGKKIEIAARAGYSVDLIDIFNNSCLRAINEENIKIDFAKVEEKYGIEICNKDVKNYYNLSPKFKNDVETFYDLNKSWLQQLFSFNPDFNLKTAE